MQTLSTLINLLHEVKYKDWDLKICHIKGEPRPYIQWQWRRKCARTNKLEEQRSRKWYISQHMTKSEVVQTAFLAALQASEHEVREFFHFSNQPIFRPHYDVYRLLDLCEEGAIDTRKNPSTRGNDHEEFANLTFDSIPRRVQWKCLEEGDFPSDGDGGHDGGGGHLDAYPGY